MTIFLFGKTTPKWEEQYRSPTIRTIIIELIPSSMPSLLSKGIFYCYWTGDLDQSAFMV